MYFFIIELFCIVSLTWVVAMLELRLFYPRAKDDELQVCRNIKENECDKGGIKRCNFAAPHYGGLEKAVACSHTHLEILSSNKIT